MREVGVILAFDGRDAANHRVDLRRFGHALVGFDHVLSAGIFALVENRLPKQRERLPFDISAEEPREGSVEVPAILMTVYQAGQGTLPFVIGKIAQKGPDILWHWVSYVFKTLGGRTKDADPHFRKLIEFTEKLHGAEILDRERQRHFFLDVIDRIKPHAANVVAPLGDSAEVVQFKLSDDHAGTEITEIDVAMAAAVRSKEVLEVGDIEEMEIRIDGVIKHSSRVSVERPSEPGKFIPAEVRDPAFDQRPNAYTKALECDEVLVVQAKPTYRGGELYRLYIMDVITKAA